MKAEQLEKFRVWFDNYVAGFYGDDEYVNANLKLKEDHSHRTCQQMLYLVDELGLTQEQRRLAEAVALFHDIGRFKQFVEHKTYHDPRSLNHCILGLQILRETGVLESLEEKEKQIIESAVECHGMKELPSGLDGDCLLYSKLIRDADKLDIFYIVIEGYRQYRDNPESFNFEVELPDEPQYSAEIAEKVLAGRRIDYNMLRTWNDMKLLQLSWVYDVNFAASLKRMKEFRLPEQIFEFLPRCDDIEKIRQKVLDYMDARIEQGG